MIHICDKNSTIKMGIGRYGTDFDPTVCFSVPDLLRQYPSVCGKYMAVYNPARKLVYSSERKISVRYPLELWWWSSHNGEDDVRCLDLNRGSEMRLFCFFLPHAIKTFGEDATKLFKSILESASEPHGFQGDNLPTFDVLKYRTLKSNVREKGASFAVYHTKVCTMTVTDDPVYVQEYKIGHRKCDGDICNEIPSMLDNFQNSSWSYELTY